MADHVVLTYDLAKQLWADNPQHHEKGVPVHGSRTRMFRNRNGSFTVRHKYRRDYRTHEATLFTVMPGDKYTLGDFFQRGYYGYSRRGGRGIDPLWKRIRDLTPLRPDPSDDDYRSYWNEVWGIRPNRGRKPQPTRVEEVRQPFWVPKDSNDRSRYDEHVSKFGSLEKWHEAYHHFSTARRKAQEKIDKWTSTFKVTPFPGMVFDAEGVVSQRSLDREEQRTRREQRDAAARTKRYYAQQAKQTAKYERERKARERAAEKRRKSLTKISDKVTAVVAKMPVESVEYILDRALVVNEDATVKMVKAVGPDLKSQRGALYALNATVEAPDYNGRAYHCGGGLHFSPTFGAAKQWAPAEAIGLECHVDMESFLVVGHSKIKARSCKVVRKLTVEEQDSDNPFAS